MHTHRRSSRLRLVIASVVASTLFAVPDAGAVKVDFLWVIDNSPSMAGEQQVLASTANAIEDQLAHARCEIDWRMAVAYTDLHRAPTSNDVCADAVGPGRRRVCPFTRDIDVFREGTPECAYVKPGTCGDGSERGFNAARVAIERFLAGQGCEPVPNASCDLRADAQLSVIFMTDTGEQTPNDVPPPFEPDNSVSSWAGFFSDYDHFRPGLQRAQVHGILCPVRPEPGEASAPCSDKLFDPALYDRYSDLIEQMGGVEGSIRDTDETKLPATIATLVDATIAQACCGNGVVDPGEECDDGNGANGDCCSSTCHLESAATVCRSAAGPCDVAERCTGTSPVCPADVKSTAVCRPAAHRCDAAESCDGVSNSCPADRSAADGTSCDDGSACSRRDLCRGGVCTGEDMVTCTSRDQCHQAGSCDPATGQCSNPAKPDDSVCDDGNGCTRSDLCQGGTCVGQDPVTCSASDACHVAGTCDPATGTCSNPAQVDGTPCDDGSACTRQDACEAGRCVGADPVTCGLDQCHVAGTCNPATGVCFDPPRPDGSVCDDGNACTQGDSCRGGSCVGGPEVRCSAPDQCHAATACNAATGACAIIALPDATACDDGDACTGGDSCWGGMGCKGTQQVSCDDANACTTDACDHATGCSNTRIEGLDGVTCLCDNGLDTLWCGDTVPALIQRPFAKACRMLNRARGANAKRSRAMMIRAKKILKKTTRAVTRANKRHLITHDCAMDMFGVMGDASTRVRALTAIRVRP